MTGAPAIAVIVTVVLGLAGHTISLIGMMYIYAWIMNHTKSVFLAIIFHALNNLVPLTLVGGMNPSLGTIMAVVPWILVFVPERVYGKDEFPGTAAEMA